MRFKVMALLGLMSPVVSAGMVVEGEQVAIYYGDGGTWTDDDLGGCMQMFVDPSWRDFCYAGTRFQQVSFRYNIAGLADVEHTGGASTGWELSLIHI